MLTKRLSFPMWPIVIPFTAQDNSPKFKEDLFKLEDRDWYLIPTAEVPLTNLKKKELFSKDELPLKVLCLNSLFS